MKKPRNHYDNLKVDRSASTADIRKAYRRLASLHHPDKNAGCAKSLRAMQCINRAYEVLSNGPSRAAHDAWIDSNAAASQQSTQQGEPKTQYKEDPKPRQESQQSQHENNESSGYSSSFWDGFDSMYGSWGSSKPTLKTEERPQSFDEKHYDEFVTYNDVMRRHFRELNLSYLTPELIYRSFQIDKQWGRNPPKNIANAYKAITRAMDRPEDGRFDKIAGRYTNLAPVVQGAMVASAFFGFVFIPVLWLLGI